MATTARVVRLASNATRPLAETAFDALRDAVLVVDARPKHLPLVLANATARRCFAGESGAAVLAGSSLYALLGAATDSVIQAVLRSQPGGRAGVTRLLVWRLPHGDTPLTTELKFLESGAGQRMVMLRFAEPTDPGLFAAIDRLPTDGVAPDPRKLTEVALENTTDWLKLSMNMAHMHAWRWDRATDTLDFADVDGQVVNRPRVAQGMKKLMARVHSKDRVAVRRALDRAFARHLDVRTKFRLKSHDGRYRWYAAVARPLFDASDRPSVLVGVTQDVTERHDAETRLRRSEELLRATTANTADTLLLVDTGLRIRFANRGVRGMAIERLSGRHISILLPEPARVAVLARLRRVLTSAEPATYEFDFQVNGATEYWENCAVLVRDDGIGTGISITMRNITERKRLEQEILDISSRERQTIGRDLHDGLGQELTGVALMLRGLAARLQRQSPDAVEQVNEIVVSVNQSIETARALARGLLPVNTETGGLSAALRLLADRSRSLYGFAVNFRAEVALEVTLSEASASHLYRIAQEALTNTARHASASAATVWLLIGHNKFVLEIADDGRGLRDSHGSAAGMGLKIMKYRADRIGAKFEIASNHPRGTVVRVTGEQPLVTSALHCDNAI